MSVRRNKAESVIPKRVPIISRECEVLRLYTLGFTYEEMGQELAISPKTIGGYLQNIRESIRAKSKADVVAYALNAGLLTPKRQ